MRPCLTGEVGNRHELGHVTSLQVDVGEFLLEPGPPFDLVSGSLLYSELNFWVFSFVLKMFVG